MDSLEKLKGKLELAKKAREDMKKLASSQRDELKDNMFGAMALSNTDNILMGYEMKINILECTIEAIEEIRKEKVNAKDR